MHHDGLQFYLIEGSSRRGAQGQPGTDAANPRANNVMGSVIRWVENGDFDGTSFRWDHLVRAGDPDQARPEARGNVKGETGSVARTGAPPSSTSSIRARRPRCGWTATRRTRPATRSGPTAARARARPRWSSASATGV